MGIDDAWQSLQSVAELIRQADTKASVILTADSVLLGLVVVQVPRRADLLHPIAPTVLVVVALVCLIASFMLSLLVVLPRLFVRDQRTSLLYFNHIATRYAGRSRDFVREYRILVADRSALSLRSLTRSGRTA